MCKEGTLCLEGTPYKALSCPPTHREWHKKMNLKPPLPKDESNLQKKLVSIIIVPLKFCTTHPPPSSPLPAALYGAVCVSACGLPAPRLPQHGRVGGVPVSRCGQVRGGTGVGETPAGLPQKVQWNLQIKDTFKTQLLYREVVLIWSVLYQRFHCRRQIFFPLQFHCKQVGLDRGQTERDPPSSPEETEQCRLPADQGDLLLPQHWCSGSPASSGHQEQEDQSCRHQNQR